jgi:hypothetical protein
MAYKNYFSLVLLLSCFFLTAQTGIGTTTPDASAKLEVASTNQGFLPPRIALTATNAASPVTSPAIGLLVYNTESAGTTPNNVTPGYYYWNGSLWVRLNGPSDTAANVTGVVPVVNGGTGVTTATGSGKTVLSNNPTLELLTISSGATQFPSSIFVTPTTFASSKRAALWLGDWGILQDYDGNGQPNFSITQNFSGSYPTRFFISTVGNVGLGTSSPTVRLQVAGDIIANSIAGSSDSRFKTNILPIENPLQKVQQLRGVTFDWKTKEFPERAFSDNRALGFIAQEVEQVLPEVVQTEKTAEGYKSVQYDKVVALLVEAIKEQQKQIEVLQKQIKKIKKRKK